MNEKIHRLAFSLGYAFGALAVMAATSLLVGVLVWGICNFMLLGLFFETPITYIQSVGLVLLTDLLLTPSTFFTMRLSQDQKTTSVESSQVS